LGVAVGVGVGGKGVAVGVGDGGKGGAETTFTPSRGPEAEPVESETQQCPLEAGINTHHQRGSS